MSKRTVSSLKAASTAMAIFALTACAQAAQPDAKPHDDAGPAVYIVNLKSGDVVQSPFRVVFGLYGHGVAPAGIAKANTGHHHLLVDTALSEEELGFAIPGDEQHIHFGGGQTETVLDLPPGSHTLQLMLGDFQHMPHQVVQPSTPITITVQ